MAREEEKLILGKGVFFVKSQLRRLRQEDDIWEADFFSVPRQRLWIGLVIRHTDDCVLAHQTIEERPTVNHLARLLAEAMRRPLGEFAHRPRTLYIRERPEWSELVPHLKQVGIQVVYQKALPKWDKAFGDLQAQVEQARAEEAAHARDRHPGKERTIMEENTNDSEKAFRVLVRVLEEAVLAGASSVGLEYKGRDLMVFHNFGNIGLGVSRIPQELQQAVIEEMVKRAGLSRKPRGKMQVRLLDKDYEAIVEEYDSFGESAFNLILKERKKKVGG